MEECGLQTNYKTFLLQIPPLPKANAVIKVEQRLPGQGPGQLGIHYGPEQIPNPITDVELADKCLAWLSSERLYQKMTETETHSQELYRGP